GSPIVRCVVTEGRRGDSSTGICSNPDIRCDDHDSCYDFATCLLACGTGPSGTVNCPDFTPLCESELIPAAVTRPSDVARVSIETAKASGKKKAMALLKQAV